MDSLFPGSWKIRRNWRYDIIGIFLDLYSGILSLIVSLYFISIKIYYPLAYILLRYKVYRFSSVQSLSHVQLFVTPWIAACQASLSITISRSSLRLTSIKSVMPASHLILCHPLLLLPSILPSIRVFSNELALGIRWPVYWSFLSHYFCPIFYDFSKVTQPLECLRNKHLCFLYL